MHGKKIGIIENMYKKIMIGGKNTAWTTRDGVRVYELNLIQENILVLKHYGTTTLIYDIAKKKINDYYGESASDRDSMNTLLFLLGHDQKYFFRFGPVMGFILEGPENDSKEFDEVEFIINYESGILNDDEIIKGFQALINSGIVWKLQGSYGRTARALIENGFCTA